jgi:CBS-domain-containing membrane protein
MKIRDVMTPDIEVVTPDDKLRTAARLMADLDFEALPVGEDNKLVGMITGRDIAVRIVAEGATPKRLPSARRCPPTCFIVSRARAPRTCLGRWAIGGSGACRW